MHVCVEIFMKSQNFIVEQKPLLSILASMQPICTKRTTLDTTSYILFEIGHKEVILKSTDLEISLQASYPFKESSIDEPIAFLVSGRRIFDLIKELDGDITMYIADQQLHVQSGQVKLALHIKDAQEFPPFPERIENLMHMDAALFLEILNKVTFAIPQNNANPSLNGLYVEINPENTKFTATDGHCLTQVVTSDYTLAQARDWLLPRRAVFEVKKILEGLENSTIFVGTCNNQLVFSGESFNFFTKLLADPFPQYQTILDKTAFVPARVDRSTFIKTLRRSACLLSGQFIATQFDFDNQSIKVTMNNNEVGELKEEVPLTDFTGEQLGIRFYAPYLLSGLQVFPHEDIQFYLKNTTKPIMFEASLDRYQLVYLVMPVAPTNGS